MVSGGLLAMAKSLVFANGRLHVGLDEYGLVRDLYYPYVGLENHVPAHGLAHKIGVYVDGKLSWLDDETWVFTAAYHEKAMIGETIATNQALGIRVELTDCVVEGVDAFLRSIHVINLTSDPRHMTLYCHQAFMMSESASSDSAQYRPDLPGIMHYKGNRVFIATLSQHDDTFFSDFSIGKYSDTDGTGTYRDAEDGRLEKNTVENGHVDSVLGSDIDIEPYGSTRLDYWLAAGETVMDAEIAYDELKTNGTLHHLTETASYWRGWLEKAAVARTLPDNLQIAFERSLLVIKAHLDERGAVMASLDSSLRGHPQDDAYNFCWPRDAFYSLWPLLRLGYIDELTRFFDFAEQGLHIDGYLQHKYRADGSLGSTWLPYVHPDGSVHPPIQADETAGVLFLLGQYHRHTNDQEFIVERYERMIEPMANFLASYVGDDGMPLPSYDLWEHSYLTHTYTTAVTYAGLVEAVELAEAYGRSEDASRWRQAAETMKSGAGRFYNSEKHYFYKGFSSYTGEAVYDDTIDLSSLYGAFMFGLFELDSPELTDAITTAQQVLSDGSLYSRFEGDSYYGDAKTLNDWPIVSLWMAEIALERDEIETAEQTLEAVLSLQSASGMLPEQVRHGTHEVTSLSPLVWSHAELVSTIIDYMQAKRT